MCITSLKLQFHLDVVLMVIMDIGRRKQGKGILVHLNVWEKRESESEIEEKEVVRWN